MSWSLDSDRPIFQQIVEHIQMQILSGKYAPGDKVPSVRDLAMEAAVNPNTMQKALSELERKGLVYTQRTSGRFITEDQEMIGRLKEEKANEAIETFFRCMEQIGYGKREAAAVLSRRSAAVSEAAGAGAAAAAQDGREPAPGAAAAAQDGREPAPGVAAAAQDGREPAPDVAAAAQDGGEPAPGVAAAAQNGREFAPGVAAAAQNGGESAPGAQAARQEENGPAADDPAISEERKQG